MLLTKNGLSVDICLFSVAYFAKNLVNFLSGIGILSPYILRKGTGLCLFNVLFLVLALINL
jgi:hypothetical protein